MHRELYCSSSAPSRQKDPELHYLRPVIPFAEVIWALMPPWHRFKICVTRVLYITVVGLVLLLRLSA